MFTKFLKYLSIFVLLLSISVSIYYQSTNTTYLKIRFFHQLFTWKYQFLPSNDTRNLSHEYKAFETLLRRRTIADFNETHDPLVAIQEIRKIFNLKEVIPKSSKCRVTKQQYSSNNHVIDGYWVNWDGREREIINSENIILYFHGGAYMSGDIDSYSGWECHLSQVFNCSVLHLEYRLVPEFPLPAAVDDSVALYEALLKQDSSIHKRIIGMGDSAGGGLWLLTLQALVNKAIPVPRGVIAISPWTDLTFSGPSYTKNKDLDAMLKYDRLSWSIEQVLGGKKLIEASKLQANNPIFSPLFGSFDGFPPIYLTVGTGELLESDSIMVHEKAKEAQVDATLEVGEHLAHVYPIFYLYFPEARQTIENIRQWVMNKV
ncbi:unnamed protein product [Didymodactylos carnosus]|uniref:Alpha/beta hydrolase fold-3 domain-containing protein n=1 Tax=Didymodactylos carnosus TaxID=1234261 RepID=A0A815PIP3_9BILA|nr:unnamed protein product [Didymodactylos carnosus]CAF1450007.1 unnamed protein product [Didymodactylos carnosus]CAF3873240.1 unnamed protein product [Didymodactylos carnosus]CAF4323599.1 unnamed protein product [Didymodactylos carnosus]